MRPRRTILTLLTLICLVTPADLAAQSQDDAKATAELLADRTALVPGQPATLAVPFVVKDGWHLYWRNPGGPGMAASVQWTLPPGFEAGPLQFPAPRRYPTTVEDSFVLGSRPVLLAELTVPDDTPTDEPVTLTGRLRWLVCDKNSCVLEDQTLSITLPIVADASKSEAANENRFRAARRALPVASDAAEYIALRVLADVDRVRPKDHFRIAIVVDIKEGHHIQSNKPLQKESHATDVFPDTVAGLTIGDATYPEAARREIAGIGTVAEFHGRLAIVLPVKAEPDLNGPTTTITGVLTYQACDDRTGSCAPPETVEWSVTIPVAEEGVTVTSLHADIFSAAEPVASDDATTAPSQRPLLLWLILAILAGLILNVTPCVLPVISIKVLSFVQQAQESPARVLKLGLAFAAGMMLVFNVLAGLATGASLVWGQHFQSPVFVLVMTAIIFAFGLSLFGVFTLGVPRTLEEAASRQEREGYIGSVAKGALATAMGTPCLGPVLGSVLTWSVSQPTSVVFLVFNAIGVGMAAPYIILTANPRWLRHMPRPGAWMETFKHVMGFVLMATVVYLLSILQGQPDGPGIVWTLAFLLGVALACWLWGRYVTFDRTPMTRMAVRLVAIAIIGLSWAGAIHTSQTPGRIEWQPFSRTTLDELTRAGHTVMVDVTADWCLNCKYNLMFVLDSQAVARAVNDNDVVPLVADWTGHDEEIGAFINELAPGASIPLLAIFPAGRPDEPIVLLGILTKDLVIERLTEAGPSKPAADIPAAEPRIPPVVAPPDDLEALFKK